MTIFNELSGVDVTSLVELLRTHPASAYSGKHRGFTHAGSDLPSHRQSLSSGVHVLTRCSAVRRDDSQTWRVGGMNAALDVLLAREDDEP